jgi:hypothetical protein
MYRKLPVHYLVQPATTPIYRPTSPVNWSAAWMSQRAVWLASPRSHPNLHSPASLQQTTELRSTRKLRTSPGRWRHSAPSRTTSEPASQTLPSAPETPTPVPKILAPAPEIPALPPETTTAKKAYEYPTCSLTQRVLQVCITGWYQVALFRANSCRRVFV